MNRLQVPYGDRRICKHDLPELLNILSLFCKNVSCHPSRTSAGEPLGVLPAAKLTIGIANALGKASVD